MKILEENGYSSAATIGLISPEIVGEIERYTENNLHDVINSLNCCNAETYKKQTSFKFLPGHHHFVLNLPTEIAKMKQQMPMPMPSRSRTPNIADHKKQQKQKTIDSNTGVRAEFVSVPESVQSSHRDIIDESETTNDHDSLVEALKHELIEKLKNRGKSKGCDWEKLLNVNLIDEIELNVDGNGEVIDGNCRLACPTCGTKYLSKYDRYWKTSNLLKHFESHEKSQESNAGSIDDKENSAPVSTGHINNDFIDYLTSGTSDDELQRSIQLQIDRLASPDEAQSKHSKTTKRGRKPKANLK